MTLRSMLLSIDIFAFRPYLLIDKKAQLGTLFGSIFTILITCLFLFLFFSSDFLLKTNPKVFSQQFTYPYHQIPALKFSKESFPIYFALIDSSLTTYNDSGIFGFELNQLKLKISGGIEYQVEETTKIEIKKCQSEDLLPLKIFQNEEVNFVVSEEQYFYCLANQELILQEDFGEGEINQVTISLSPCSNLTSKVICKSPEVIQKFFEDPKLFFFGYVEFNENVEEFENSIVKNFIYEQYEISYTQQIQNVISLKRTFFKTTSGIYEETINKLIKFDEKRIDYSLYNKNDLVELTFEVGKNYEKVTRTYQTIGEALASTFSVVKLVIILIKMLMWFINKIKIKLYLVNKLYDFDFHEEQKTTQKLYELKENLKKPDGQNIGGMQKTLNLSICQALIAEIKSIFFKKRTSYKERLYLETKEIILRDTNIVYILQKLQEIEKIKLILFNKNQLFLFNHLSKPSISLSNFHEKQTPGQLLAESLNFFERKNLNNGGYEIELKKNLKNASNSENKRNKRLLRLLDVRYTDLKDANLKTSKNIIPEFRRYTIS